MPLRASASLQALLLAAFCSPVMARTPIDIGNARQTISMDYLMESCTVVGETAGGLVNYFDCESYLYGLLDAQAQLNSQVPPADRICLPPAMAPWQVYDRLARLEGGEDWSGPAAPIILRVLRQQFPCS